MARKMQRRVASDWLLTFVAAAVLFSAGRCSAQLTANRHTLRYDGEVNIGEIGGQNWTELDVGDRSIDGSTDFLGIELSCATFGFRRLLVKGGRERFGVKCEQGRSPNSRAGRCPSNPSLQLIDYPFGASAFGITYPYRQNIPWDVSYRSGHPLGLLTIRAK